MRSNNEMRVITMRLTDGVGFTNDNKSPSIHGRVIRATPDRENPPLRVRIHNIRSARPEPEIEILYAVYEDGDGKQTDGLSLPDLSASSV